MIRIILMIMMTSLLGILTGCSSMNSGFDCPNKAGVMCKSVDQIDAMVDHGQLPGMGQPVSEVTASNAEFQPYAITPMFHHGTPFRYGETVQRIWVAPYTDTENNYHQDSFMYVIIKDGHWVGTPVKSLVAV